MFKIYNIHIFILYILLLYSKKNKIRQTLKIFNDYSKFYPTKYLYNCSIMYKPTIRYTFYKYIVVTLSNPCNANIRNLQRNYRLKKINSILFIYVVGINECKRAIYYENNIFGDILFLNIKNHYFNITVIFLESINWINVNIKFDYLIKWDDDIIVNIPLLFIFINIQEKKIDYSGYLYNKTRVCRKKSKICYVPYSIYNKSYLPSFVASGILVLSNFASYMLDKYHRVLKSYMIRDDQYIGVIFNKLSIKPFAINKYYIRVNTLNTTFNIKSLLSYHTNNINELDSLYKSLYNENM